MLCPDTIPIVIGDPESRGRGIGSRVLLLLIDEARSRGWSVLRLRKVYVDNLASLRMYGRAGFRSQGQGIDDAGRRFIRMRLDLTAGPKR